MLTVRKARKEDAVFITTIMLSAMEEIVFDFIGRRDHEEAFRFMHHFVSGTDNQYAYTNCVIGEWNNETVSAANVYDGADLQNLRQPVLDYIHRNYRKDYLPDNETQAGEMYIDTFGIRADKRKQGFGVQLLQWLKTEYVICQHKTLGLLVEHDNTPAKSLYAKLGFVCVNRKNVFGKNMEHLQLIPGIIPPSPHDA